MAVDVHPEVAMLAPLLGTWQGSGDGEYPTIDDFGYVESSTFDHVGKPFVSFVQRTRATDDDRPLHSECGYLRLPAPGHVELVIAHPSGLAEVAEGSIEATSDGLLIDLRSTTIGATASAKDVSIVERTFELSGDELSYSLRMAAVGEPLSHHLAAVLHRAG